MNTANAAPSGPRTHGEGSRKNGAFDEIQRQAFEPWLPAMFDLGGEA